MRVIRRDFYDASDMKMRLYPLGDVHIGAAACDEEAFAAAVRQIAADPSAYWVGMGDYLEAINRNDKRFDPTTLAPWITTRDLVDLARAQLDRFLGLIQPIAHKCLGLVKGNHEDELIKRFEHDIYGDLIREVKRLGGLEADLPLRLGYAGYLQLSFFKGNDRKSGSRLITIHTHHGAGGGKKTGSVISNLEDYLARKSCDLVLVGHTHRLASTHIGVEYVAPRSGRVFVYPRYAVVCSTFLRSHLEDHDGTYAERKMLYPLALGRSEIILQPHAPDGEPRVKVTTW